MNLTGILAASTRTVLLVEGASDRAAVETLADRLDLPLSRLGVQVVAMGGVTNLGHHLAALGGFPHDPAAHDPATHTATSPRSTAQTVVAQEAVGVGRDVRVGGLYDVGEERFVVNTLDRVGLRPFTATTPLTELGFFRCDRDLEDELIRAVGVDEFLDLIATEGELRSFERLRDQPAQRDRTITQQLHRFIGSKGGRKERYGRRLAQALPLDRVPAPLDGLLHWAV